MYNRYDIDDAANEKIANSIAQYSRLDFLKNLNKGLPFNQEYINKFTNLLISNFLIAIHSLDKKQLNQYIASWIDVIRRCYAKDDYQSVAAFVACFDNEILKKLIPQEAIDYINKCYKDDITHWNDPTTLHKIITNKQQHITIPLFLIEKYDKIILQEFLITHLRKAVNAINLKEEDIISICKGSFFDATLFSTLFQTEAKRLVRFDSTKMDSLKNLLIKDMKLKENLINKIVNNIFSANENLDSETIHALEQTDATLATIEDWKKLQDHIQKNKKQPLSELSMISEKDQEESKENIKSKSILTKEDTTIHFTILSNVKNTTMIPIDVDFKKSATIYDPATRLVKKIRQ